MMMEVLVAYADHFQFLHVWNGFVSSLPFKDPPHPRPATITTLALLTFLLCAA
jgi:hypothetical protein